MATKTPEEKLDYVLTVLSSSEGFKPDYHAVALAKTINNANNAQKRFKAYVEETGKFKLVNGKVIISDATSDTACSTTQTESKKSPKPTGEKRKVNNEKVDQTKPAKKCKSALTDEMIEAAEG